MSESRWALISINKWTGNLKSLHLNGGAAVKVDYQFGEMLHGWVESGGVAKFELVLGSAAVCRTSKSWVVLRPHAYWLGECPGEVNVLHVENGHPAGRLQQPLWIICISWSKTTKQEGNVPVDLRLLGIMRNNFAILQNFFCCAISCCLPTSYLAGLGGHSNLLTASMAIKVKFDLRLTSVTLKSMCILPVVAILVAFEVTVTSIWPQRSLLTSNLNSVASISHVPVLPWPL